MSWVRRHVFVLCGALLVALAGVAFLNLEEILNSLRAPPNFANEFVAAADEPPVVKEETFIVRKQTYSNTTRIIFWAGLGGTGHHGWKQSIDNTTAVRHAEKLTQAVVALWYKDGQLEPVISRMKELGPGFHAVNLVKKHVMLSYPDHNAERRHPDIAQLALAAERANVDLRVVVLLRDSRDLVVSTALHREFLPVLEEIVQMRNQLDHIVMQLMMIDPKFYSCIRFENTLRHAQHVIDHMLVPGSHRAAELLASTRRHFHEARRNEEERASLPPQFSFNMLDERSTFLERLCNGRSSQTAEDGGLAA